MTNGWSGADPTGQNDGASANYEFATRYTANANISITGIRIWANNSVNVPNRNAHIWDTSGNALVVLDIPDTLPTTGWTTYNLVTPYAISAGTRFDVSYSTTQYYGAISNADFPRPSSDGAVTAAITRYQTVIGIYPTTPAGSFQGVDIVYTASGANTPPVITGMSVSKADLFVQSSVNVTDDFPATVAVTWEWGDGTSTITGAGVTTSSHTYSQSGLYAVMATAIDSGALQDSAAQAVNLSASLTATATEEWLDDILDAVVSDAQSSGYFDRVNTHEPKRKPGKGITAAIWVQNIVPIPLNSGLASTSAQIVFMLRMYTNMLRESQDSIDPALMHATSNLMRRYHDDFDFQGTIRNIDLLGQFGVSLAAQAGYIEMDGTMFRTMDITIPCIVNDVWPQVS